MQKMQEIIKEKNDILKFQKDENIQKSKHNDSVHSNQETKPKHSKQKGGKKKNKHDVKKEVKIDPKAQNKPTNLAQTTKSHSTLPNITEPDILIQKEKQEDSHKKVQPSSAQQDINRNKQEQSKSGKVKHKKGQSLSKNKQDNKINERSVERRVSEEVQETQPDSNVHKISENVTPTKKKQEKIKESAKDKKQEVQKQQKGNDPVKKDARKVKTITIAVTEQKIEISQKSKTQEKVHKKKQKETQNQNNKSKLHEQEEQPSKEDQKIVQPTEIFEEALPKSDVLAKQEASSEAQESSPQELNEEKRQDKAYSRQESSKASAKSESHAPQSAKHLYSKDSWNDHDEANESEQQKSNNTEDDKGGEIVEEKQKQSHTSKYSASQYSNDESLEHKPSDSYIQRYHHANEGAASDNEKPLHRGQRLYGNRGREFDGDYRPNKPNSYQDYKKSRKVDNRKPGAFNPRGVYSQYPSYPNRGRRGQNYAGKQYENPTYRRPYNQGKYYYDNYASRDYYLQDKDEYYSLEDPSKDESSSTPQYENEFYKTNYHTTKQNLYDSSKQRPAAEYENDKARSDQAYEQFVQEHFYAEGEDNQEEESKFVEEKHEGQDFYNDQDQFYEDGDGDGDDDDEDINKDQGNEEMEEEEDKDYLQQENKNTFFNDEEFSNAPYSLFQGFGAPDQEFSLFAPMNYNMYEQQQNPLRFDFMEDSNAQDMKDSDDDLFYRFDNLQELREESENFNYDIANKDISTKIANKKQS